MGRGYAEARESLMRSSAILDRARLEHSGNAVRPAHVAAAVRAELWHGTLAGARAQARIGCAQLADSAEIWRTPALLYLGMGGQAVLDAARECEDAIVKELTARCGDMRVSAEQLSIAAAAELLELGDVLGPLVALCNSTALAGLAADLRELGAIVVAAAEGADDGLAAAAARRASMRIACWLEIGRGGAVAAELLNSYDDLPDDEGEWDLSPRLELVMALDIAESESFNFTTHLRSLPAVLKTERWSQPSAPPEAGR